MIEFTRHRLLTFILMMMSALELVADSTSTYFIDIDGIYPLYQLERHSDYYRPKRNWVNYGGTVQVGYRHKRSVVSIGLGMRTFNYYDVVNENARDPFFDIVDKWDFKINIFETNVLVSRQLLCRSKLNLSLDIGIQRSKLLTTNAAITFVDTTIESEYDNEQFSPGYSVLLGTHQEFNTRNTRLKLLLGLSSLYQIKSDRSGLYLPFRYNEGKFRGQLSVGIRYLFL